MSGWIKYDKDLETDPRFVRMLGKLRHAPVTLSSLGGDAAALRDAQLRSLLAGALARFWAYADTHIRADDCLELGSDDVDALVGVPGFCMAMPEDWLVVLDDSSVELVGYQRHNGIEARKRALAQKRQESKRRRDHSAVVTPVRDGGVTGALPDQTRPDQTKTNEETHTAAAPRRPRASGRPTDLTDDQFTGLKAAYPSRAGDYRWPKARFHINAALAEGEDLAVILAGFERYRAFSLAKGQVGTEFVKQASTFCSQRAWREDWKAPAAHANGHSSSPRPTRYQQSRQALAAASGVTVEQLDADLD